MAFANLFTRLSAVEEDVKSPVQPVFAHRNNTGNCKRGKARKRKAQGEQTRPYEKKQCYINQTTRTYDAQSFKDDDSKSKHHIQNTYREHSSVGFNKDVIHNHSGKAGHHNVSHKGQNNKSIHNHNLNKQQGWKKEWQSNQHQQKDRGRPAYRGGRHTSRKGGDYRKNRNDKQNSEVKFTRSMTQEFKDQNALLVDGRLICRYFFRGKCIKGDECQLEHVQGYNDLVKEACKFYIQGTCTKGESCPYMHKSFPCKFFHRKGKCSQGANCRFSHEPLNDITSKLLEEALKRESELHELAKKAEQESSGQLVNTEESENVVENETPDILLQPLRPNFYQSVKTNADKDSLLPQTEELTENIEEAVAPHESDAAQTNSPPSTNLNQKELVCYSVEAVLGPQLSKPFPSFFTAPRSQESAPLSSSDHTPVSANQSQVPYSVEAVLGSFKSVETPPHPTAQTVSFTPKTYFKELTDPLLNSETQNKKAWYSVNNRNEGKNSQEKMFKSLPSLQAHTSLISKTYPNHALASRDPKTQVVNMQESLKPVHEINFELHSQKSSFNSKGDIKGSKHLATDIMHSVNCKSEDVVHLRPTQHKTLYSCSTSSEHPLQSRPNVCGLTSDSQASFKPYFPSSGFTELKGKATVLTEPISSSIKSSDSADSVSLHPAAKQPTESHLHSKETTADVSSKMPHGGGLAVGFKKTMKKPFNSLFANSIITDSLLPKDDSVTSLSRPQGLIQSPCPAPKSSRSFVSRFAAPLSAAPLPCIQSQPDHTRTSFGSEKPARFTDVASCFSNSKRKAANLETPLKRRVKTDVREISHTLRSPQVSPDPEIGNEGSSIDCKIQRVNPACGLVYSSIREQSKCPTPCVKSQTTTHAQQLLPDILSCKEVAAKSVLRTLFQHLSPYHQDGKQQDSVQISIPPETEGKDKNSTGCVFEEQQLKSNKTGRRKKKLKTPQTTEITEQQPSLQTPHISSKAAGGSTLSRPGMTEPQVRDSGTHYLPSNTLMQHHIEPRRKTPSQERQCVNGNVGTTPLKDLFKTLDFHFGH